MSKRKVALAFAIVMQLVFGMTSLPAVAQVPDAGTDVVALGRLSHAPAIVGATNDNDELLASYIEQQFDEQLLANELVLPAQSEAGSYLSGNEALVYRKLRPLIEQVAAGAVTNTKLTLSVDEFEGPMSWTAAELGVDAILSGDDLAPDAANAFDAKLEEAIDCGVVMNALTADCPYELYWFDKTVGLTMTYDLEYWEDEAGEHLGANNPEFALPVADAYADKDYVGDEWDNGVIYAVRTDVGSRVQTAVDNASRIAAAHANEHPYARLHSYKEAICDLTSYNGAASRGGVAYGDPWQLVWVFDDDPSTTVVCEGYAKAFKYLCDLSNKDDVECITATGLLFTMQSGAGEGHMWNVVRMPDFKNYLVDVTNCDGGSFGAPEGLFLVSCTGGSCDTGYTFAAPTAWGSVRYVYDAEIRAVFLDEDLAISDVVYDESAEHAWGEPTYVWSADNSQVTATRVCAYDASHVETETVAASFAITTSATCKAEGVLTYTSAAFANAAFAVQTRSKPIAALGHDYAARVVEATWDVAGYTSHTCTRCGDEYRTDKTKALKDISLAGATITVANQTYTGKALKPKPTVKLGGKTLVAGTDYTVAYENNVKTGTAKVTVTGKGAYIGTKTKSFTIAKAASSIKLAAQTKTYTGKALAYTGKVSKTGSSGKVTYAYYSDKSCKKAVKAANVKAAGVYYVKATVAADDNYKKATSDAVKFTVAKAANPMVVKAVARTAKLATVKKKAVTVAAPLSFTRKAQGKVTYAKVSGSSSALTVNKTTGKVTVKKGTKKGTYTIKIKVTAAGNANYKALTKTIACKIVVK